MRKTATTIDAELDIRMKSTDEEFVVYDVSDIQLSKNSGTIELTYEGEYKRVPHLFETPSKLTLSKSADFNPYSNAETGPEKCCLVRIDSYLTTTTL